MPPLDPKTERAIAVDLFHHVWSLLDKPQRTLEEDAAMIHAAHASLHHWMRVGEPLNFARGEWQVSRVYAVLGRAEPALWHAKRSLAICEAHGIGDFDIAFAHEAMARALAATGDAVKSREHADRARAFGEKIAEPDDREAFLKELATLPAATGS